MSSQSSASDRPLRILSFESRRSEEMASLITRMGGVPTVAPSMREIPLSENPAAFRFAEELLAGRIDVVVFLTGVGAEALLEVISERHLLAEIVASLGRTKVVVRGPKPSAVLSKRSIRIDLKAPAPNTWRETAAAVRASFDISGRTVAVQEYGKPNESFYAELRALGATVVPVPVYRWALPEDIEPLKRAVESAAHGAFDLIAFTSAQQIENVFEVARGLDIADQLGESLRRSVLVSIGPTCSERLREYNLEPDIEAFPPKMGPMVRSALEQGRQVSARKQGGTG